MLVKTAIAPVFMGIQRFHFFKKCHGQINCPWHFSMLLYSMIPLDPCLRVHCFQQPTGHYADTVQKTDDFQIILHMLVYTRQDE